MRAIKNIIGGAIIGSLLSTTAIAHTNSVGYVGDGTGNLTVWYGSWHDGTTFNEAELKVLDSNDAKITQKQFDLLSQDSPAGLLSGVNYFTSDGKQLQPYDPNTPHPMGMPTESYTWQGATFTLAPGDYTFVYIPLGDAETTLPGDPTAEWVPMDEVIRSLSVTLTQGDIDGDANLNGILDVNEVAVGAASGGPTVVGQGSSQVIGYVAASGGVIQIVSRTQTDTTWDNMSDGTTSNVQTSSTTLDPFEGRVDQVDQMLGLNTHRMMDIADGISTGRISHDMGDGYSAETTVMGLGGSVATDNNMLISGGINRAETTMTGADSSGAMTTTLLQGRVGKALDNKDATVSVGAHVANSNLSYSRTIGDFGAAGSTSARDIGVNAMAEKSTGTVRPFVGITVGKKTVDAYDETGDVQVALSRIATDEMYRYATVGVNIDTGFLTANFSKDVGDSDATTIGLGIDKAINDRVSFAASANRLLDGNNTSTYMTAGIKIQF